MLALQTQSRIVPKIMTMADGRVALVHFLVSFEGGVIKAKIVSVRLQSADSVVFKGSNLSLCGSCEKAGEIVSSQKTYKSIISPFTSLLFFVSQPTRAPALV